MLYEWHGNQMFECYGIRREALINISEKGSTPIILSCKYSYIVSICFVRILLFGFGNVSSVIEFH